MLGDFGHTAIREAPLVRGIEIAAGVEQQLRQGTGVASIERLFGTRQETSAHSSPWSEIKSPDTDYSGVRWYHYNDLNHNYERFLDIDVIVEMIRPMEFGRVLDLAVHARKPLIIDATELSDRQRAQLLDATHTIPIMLVEDFDGLDVELVHAVFNGAKRLKWLATQPLLPYVFHKLA